MAGLQPISGTDATSADEDRATLLDLLDLADRWRHDALAEAAAEQAAAERTRMELHHLHQEIVRLHSSASWRLTAPLRMTRHWLGAFIRRATRKSD